MTAVVTQPGAAGAPDALVYRHEKTLFGIALTIALLFWVALMIGTVGIALVYVLLAFIIYLFVQSALVSYLRGNAVRIAPEQFPDLHARIQACCAKLEMPEPPQAFLMHAGGAFNAFAARFLGRHYLVLYSDVVDALESSPEALNFYIGHELGHIRRGHLAWGPLLFPALLLPLLGAAYSRSREYTCDLHGLACCPSREMAARALAALAAGGKRWKTIDLGRIAGESEATSGFWMSFHELVSGYPWLVKRIARVLGPEHEARIPSRHALGWLPAMFVPNAGVGAGGGAAVLVTIAIIGILAAVAIPAYQDYVVRAKLSAVLAEGGKVTAAVTAFYERTNAVPKDLAEAGVAPPDPASGVRAVTIDSRGVVRLELALPQLDGKTIVFLPSLDANKRVVWRCASQDVEKRYLPQSCR